jgi:hypothetical protein
MLIFLLFGAERNVGRRRLSAGGEINNRLLQAVISITVFSHFYKKSAGFSAVAVARSSSRFSASLLLAPSATYSL